MLKNYFKMCLAAGEVGESLTIQILSSIGFNVEDVSSNEEYFNKDIDLIATSGNRSMLIEVKSDYKTAKTGNVAIETITNRALNKQGWFFYTQASHIFFADIQNKIIHCVRLEELKDLYNQKKNIFKHIQLSNMEDGLYYKESEIALIPVVELKKLPHYVRLDAAELIAA